MGGRFGVRSVPAVWRAISHDVCTPVSGEAFSINMALTYSFLADITVAFVVNAFATSAHRGD